MTCNIDGDGVPSLLVAQPGGAFMKLRCKPEQLDLAEAQHKESDGEVDHGAGSEDEEKLKEKNKEDRGKKEDVEERENQQSVGEGEHEDDGEPEVKKLTEMSVEYEPLGVNRY